MASSFVSGNLRSSEKSEKQMKREAKKAEKKGKKEARKGEAGANAQSQQDAEEADSGPDVSQGKYGVAEMNQSKDKPNKSLVDIGILSPKLNNQKVWVRARLHTSRAKGKTKF